MFHRMTEQELRRLIETYIESRIDADSFSTLKDLKIKYAYCYNYLVDYFVKTLIILNEEIFLSAHGHNQSLSDNAQRELLRAAGEGHFLIFHRPIKLSDFVLTSAFIFAETLLPTLASSFLCKLAGFEAMDIGSIINPSFMEKNMNFGVKMGNYIRKIKELPEFEGIEHCVFIKASARFGTSAPFSIEDLRKTFSSTCNIPVARRWDCWARPDDPLAAYNSCEALSPKHTDPLDNAIRSLARKNYFVREDNMSPARYYIPHNVGRPE